ADGGNGFLLGLRNGHEKTVGAQHLRPIQRQFADFSEQQDAVPGTASEPAPARLAVNFARPAAQMGAGGVKWEDEWKVADGCGAGYGGGEAAHNPTVCLRRGIGVLGGTSIANLASFAVSVW